MLFSRSLFLKIPSQNNDSGYDGAAVLSRALPNLWCGFQFRPVEVLSSSKRGVKSGQCKVVREVSTHNKTSINLWLDFLSWVPKNILKDKSHFTRHFCRFFFAQYDLKVFLHQNNFPNQAIQKKQKRSERSSQRWPKKVTSLQKHLPRYEVLRPFWSSLVIKDAVKTAENGMGENTFLGWKFTLFSITHSKNHRIRIGNRMFCNHRIRPSDFSKNRCFGNPIYTAESPSSGKMAVLCKTDLVQPI